MYSRLKGIVKDNCKDKRCKGKWKAGVGKDSRVGKRQFGELSLDSHLTLYIKGLAKQSVAGDSGW